MYKSHTGWKPVPLCSYNRFLKSLPSTALQFSESSVNIQHNEKTVIAFAASGPGFQPVFLLCRAMGSARGLVPDYF
jgi:hypothetical protein